MLPKVAIASITPEDHIAPRATYGEAIRLAGGLGYYLPVVDESNIAQILGDFDALLLTGGGDVEPYRFGAEKNPNTKSIYPIRDDTEMRLLEGFEKLGKPIMGICRGMQLINAGMGGTLVQHLPDVGVKFDHTGMGRHLIRFKGESLLRDSFFGADAAVVNTSHHQAVEKLAPGFTVTAVADEDVIEAMEKGNIICVQFHPERMVHCGALPLFERFIGLI